MARKYALIVLIMGLALGLSALISSHALAQQGSDPELLKKGAELYAQNCFVCHGEQGRGRVGATLAKNWPSIRPDLEIKSIISRGVSGSPMPSWGQEYGGPLSSDQIDALVAYILTWESGEPFKYVPESAPTARPAITALPDVQGDPNKGAVLFDQNCIMCHGPNGQGRIGATLSKAWSGIRPDLSVKATISNGVSGSLMPAWSQANGGPLAEAEINDLTAFILTLPNTSSPAPAPTSSATDVPGPGLGGVGGILVTLVIFGLIVGIVLLAQRPKAS